MQLNELGASQVLDMNSALYSGHFTRLINQHETARLSQPEALDEVFNAMDVNNDGVVDRAEWEASHTAQSPKDASALLARGLERFGDTLTATGYSGANEPSDPSAPGQLSSADKKRMAALEQDLQEERFNGSVLQAELQRVRKSEGRLQEEVARLSASLAECRDELNETRDGGAEDSERLRQQADEARLAAEKVAQQADFEKAELVERMRFLEDELSQANEAADTDRQILTQSAEQLQSELAQGHGQFRRAGQSFFVERVRRMMELRQLDCQLSAFCEWKEYTLLSRGMQAQVCTYAVSLFLKCASGFNWSTGSEPELLTHS